MKYDVVIIGGGTAGCAAAYQSAKRGLKTIVLEKNSFLGGSITGALVTPAMKSSENQINTDFFNALINELNSLGGQITYIDGNPGWINPELCKIALDRLLTNVGCDIIFNANISKLVTQKQRIVSLELASIQNIPKEDLSTPIETTFDKRFAPESLSVYIEADYFIDATGNLEICKNLNCQLINDENKNQPASLRFIASGVDLERFADFITEFDKDRNATTAAHIDGAVHLSTACTWDKDWALTPFFEAAVSKRILKRSDCAYFQIFTIPGMPNSVAFNCPRFTELLTNSDFAGYSSNIINARESILRIVEFCKAYFPGFENSFITAIAPSVGTRVSTRALGKYLYTIDDLKSGKTFLNPVLVSNYPIDIHSDKKDGAVLEKLYQEYQLPVEALISADYPNLFFAGRGISADFYAQAALRIIPSCFSMGEGLANYIANLVNTK